MPPRSPFTSVTPALSIATSVPVPMAMPTSAAARAGASFTPSPAMATTRPSSRSRRISACLSAGSTSATTSAMSSLPGDRLGRGAVVAGQHDDAQPEGAQATQRLRRRRLDRVGDGDHPGGAAFDRQIQHRRAIAPQRIGFGLKVVRRDAEVAHQAGVAQRHRLPVHLAR